MLPEPAAKKLLGWAPPSLPHTVQRVNEAVSRADTSIADIVRVVQLDQSLAARLLKMANSPIYGLTTRVETITQAVVLLGTRQIRDVALATSVIELFRDIPPQLLDMTSFWRHSLACGLAARAIATARGDANAERYLVLGLLHDVGSLLIYRARPDEARRALMRNVEGGVPLHQAEAEVFGFDHASAGASLLRLWQLPAALCEPVELHHREGLAPDFPIEVATCNLADVVAHALEMGTNGERFVPHLSNAAWDALSLSPPDVDRIAGAVERSYADAEALYLAAV